MTDQPEEAPLPGGEKDQEIAQHAQRGYETLDAQAGATYRAGLYILGAMFLAAAIAVPIYSLLARHETASQPLAKTVVREEPAAAAAPSFPKLVASEPAVLAEFRKHEDELLTGYAWVEKDRGIARMPVSEAMRIVGQRGTLPNFPAAATAAGAAGGPGDAR